MPRPCRNPECPYTIPDGAAPEKLDCDRCLAKSRRWRKVGLGRAWKWHRRLRLSDSIIIALLPEEKLKEDVAPVDLLKYREQAKEGLSRPSRGKKRAKQSARA